MKRNILINIICINILCITFFSCNKDNIYENPDAKLRFSTSLVSFDTIFTSVSSITKRLVVKNPYNADIKTDVYLLGDQHSYFSININGVSAKSLKDVEIPAKDSIYIFIKVIINPNQTNLPMLVSDSILFHTNGNKQHVALLAYGQDAHFIIADKWLGNYINYKVVAGEGETVTWTNDKPYVIYGYAVVDSVGKLNIEEGTKIYFHKKGGLWVYKGGCLHVNGTQNNPVVFQGDRLEPFFEDDYEQWDRIWINEGTQDNIINYAIIKNAFIGIQAEVLERDMGNQLVLSNTVIKKSSGMGFLAKNYKVYAYNNVISDCGQYALALLQGGDYTFINNTIYNAYRLGSRATPSVFLSNYYILNNTMYLADFRCDLINNIIWGNNVREFACSYDKAAAFNANIEYCLLKSDTNYPAYFSSMLFNKNPQFENPQEYDFQLQNTSPCKGAGKVIPDILNDIKGNVRNIPPSIGAYE
ncbi:MAG: right-handed parallel beta-helix repeat-containing protein [Bacteroidales bacterium]|nr:right-handed parallel beta-helix repeat-containing protein [Bacteroidales bacterium]